MTQTLYNEATAIETELADLYAMSEEAACFRYNTDSKQEAIDILDEELKNLYKAIELASKRQKRSYTQDGQTPHSAA